MARTRLNIGEISGSIHGQEKYLSWLRFSRSPSVPSGLSRDSISIRLWPLLSKYFVIQVDSIGFWRSYITLMITGLLGFVYRLVFWKTQKYTVFRKRDVFFWGEGWETPNLLAPLGPLNEVSSFWRTQQSVSHHSPADGNIKFPKYCVLLCS